MTGNVIRLRPKSATIEGMRYDGTPECMAAIITWVRAKLDEYGASTEVSVRHVHQTPDPGLVIIITADGTLSLLPEGWVLACAGELTVVSEFRVLDAYEIVE